MNKYIASSAARFAEAERDLLETGTQPFTNDVFLTSFAGVLRNLSGCDAVELRTINQNMSYNSLITFNPSSINLKGCTYITDGTGVSIPVKQDNAPLEMLCRELYSKPAQSFGWYHYLVSARYVADTEARDGTGLAGTGYGSLLVLPFTVYDNSPGMLILYARHKNFINPDDIPNYLNLMHILPIIVRFRRTVLAYDERNKELNCLYSVNQMFQEEADNEQVILQKLVEAIPLALQYTERAYVRINVDKVLYQTGKPMTSANLIRNIEELDDGRILTIQVFYPDPDKTDYPLMFQPEEQNLLNLLMKRTTYILNRIHEKKRILNLETQMVRADKLSTIGKLSSGIVHELNDPLSNILGYAQLMLRTTKTDSDKKDLEKIVRSTLQARETVGKLLFYARQEQVKISRLSLNEVVESSLDLFKIRLDHGNVQLKLELDPELPELSADSSQLVQVVTNLCSNALQAMPEGGVLRIRTAPEQGNIKLSIADTGIGIPPDKLNNIFEPFYSTRPSGSGTGLGLFVVHSIIETYNGSITVHSKPGKGSRFDISLPCINQQNAT